MFRPHDVPSNAPEAHAAISRVGEGGRGVREGGRGVHCALCRGQKRDRCKLLSRSYVRTICPANPSPPRPLHSPPCTYPPIPYRYVLSLDWVRVLRILPQVGKGACYYWHPSTFSTANRNCLANIKITRTEKRTFKLSDERIVSCIKYTPTQWLNIVQVLIEKTQLDALGATIGRVHLSMVYTLPRWRLQIIHGFEHCRDLQNRINSVP